MPLGIIEGPVITHTIRIIESALGSGFRTWRIQNRLGHIPPLNTDDEISIALTKYFTPQIKRIQVATNIGKALSKTANPNGLFSLKNKCLDEIIETSNLMHRRDELNIQLSYALRNCLSGLSQDNLLGFHEYVRNYNCSVYNDFVRRGEELLKEKKYNEAEDISFIAYEYHKESSLNLSHDEVIKIYGKAMLLRMSQELSSKKNKVLIIGDVMLDHLMKGNEASAANVAHHQNVAPIYYLENKNHETKTIGGAGYLARAFSELTEEVFLVGIIGEDYEGESFKDKCINNIHFYPLVYKDIITTTKIYFLKWANDPKEPIVITRFDREDVRAIKSQTQCIDKIREYLESLMPGIQCILFDDYQKGLVTKELVNVTSEVVKNFNSRDSGKKIIVVDPKYDMSPFENIPIDIIMPNTKEFERIKSNIQDYKIGLIANKKGMDGAVLKRNGKDTNIEPLKGKVPENREMDVGCGAVFGAYFVSSILHGNTYEQSILLANYAAGLKVSKEFGHIVSPKDVLKDVISEENYFLSNKTVFQNILLEKSLSSHNKSSLQ